MMAGRVTVRRKDGFSGAVREEAEFDDVDLAVSFAKSMRSQIAACPDEVTIGFEAPAEGPEGRGKDD
jgi:hypothetical protein